MTKPAELKVTLVCATPNAEEVIASAAKLCYASDTDAILEQEPEGARKFVGMLKRLGHMSPIEHASVTFYVEGVSRAMTHQLVRHRIASYSQRSQRYVGHKDFEYIMPPQFQGKTIETDSGAVSAEEYFRQTMDMISERYAMLNQALGDTGEKSNEDARYVLPNACETKIFVTMNARQLLHFLEERLCMRAQWEIREMADLMLVELRKVLPSVFNGAGPKCIAHGGCTEGKMTCGKYAEMARKYAPGK